MSPPTLHYCLQLQSFLLQPHCPHRVACGGVPDMHLVGACRGTLNAFSVGQAASTQNMLQCMGMAGLIPHADPCSCIAAETAVPSAAMFGSPVSVAMLGRAAEPPVAEAVGLAQLLGQQPVAHGSEGHYNHLWQWCIREGGHPRW